MILVVVEQLNLSFLLQHQGRFLRSAKTAREAIQALQTQVGAIEGVILDDAIPNSNLVTGYVRNKAPQIPLVSWQVAQHNSPFKNVAVPLPQSVTEPQEAEGDRYVWTVRKPVPTAQ